MNVELQPAISFFAVTPSDSTALTKKARALYVGGTGDVTAVDPSGNAVTFSSVQAGTVLPIYTSQVKATGTTATNIVALL